MSSAVIARSPPSRRFWRVWGERPRTKADSSSTSPGSSGRKFRSSGTATGLPPAQAEEAADPRQQVLRLGGRVRRRRERLLDLVEVRATRADDAAHPLGDLGARQQQPLARGAVEAVSLHVGLRPPLDASAPAPEGGP